MKFGSLWDPESHRSNPKPSTKPVSSVCSLLPASLEVGGVMTKLISRNTVILSLMFWLNPDWWMLVSHGYRINHPVTTSWGILRHMECWSPSRMLVNIIKYRIIDMDRLAQQVLRKNDRLNESQRGCFLLNSSHHFVGLPPTKSGILHFLNLKLWKKIPTIV